MNYIGFTRATNVLNGKVTKGFFIFATMGDEALKAMDPYPFIAGCTMIEPALFAETISHEDSELARPPHVEFATSVNTKATSKQMRLSDTYSFSGLCIQPNEIEAKRTPLKVNSGEIEFLIEGRDGSIMMGLVNERAFLTVISGQSKDRAIQMQKISLSASLDHLALAYPEHKEKILPKGVFDGSSEYSF